MNRWSGAPLEAPAERRPLPESVQKIRIDEDAVWEDLCGNGEWNPLAEALQTLMRSVRSPQELGAAAREPGEWNLLHLSVVFELERLHYLLMARQLSERIQDLAWEEPLSSLVHGLDVAVASALETGRQLATEMNDVEDANDRGTAYEDVDEIPEWGRGFAYVLHRRFGAECQAVLDLLGAVCEEAYADEE